MTTLIHSARLVDDGRVIDDAWVRFAGGRVTASGIGSSWREADAARGADADREADAEGSAIVDARAVAGPGAVLTPGFIDLHAHGGAGSAHEEGSDAIRAARALHRAHGTTRAVVSLVSAPLPKLEAHLRTVRAMVGTDGILGAHLEGPFLGPGHRGAHDPAALRAPDPDEIDRLLAAADGSLAQVTLAPELPGALDAIARFRAAGVVVAIGHTDATSAQARTAFDAGARLVTHAFNAMRGLHHREPGPVGAATADPRVVLELIADGVHVHPELVRILFAAAPGRIALVTDAMAAAGAGDGDYSLGGLPVQVRDGVARLADGTIAGSTLTQDAALRVAVDAGVPLADAVTALTRTPARVLDRTDLGALSPGVIADAVLLTAGLQVRGVWADGKRVPPASAV